MPDNWFRRVAEGVFIDGLYDLLKVVVLSGLIGLAVALWQYFKNRPIDWWGILALFLFVSVVSGFFLRLHRQRTPNTTPEPEEPEDANGSSGFYSRSEMLVSKLSALQQDALSLSMRLLDFIKEQGDPPQPKFTVQQINSMSAEDIKQRILANDKDFDFACEYHFGGHDDIQEGVNTAVKFHTQMMARITLLDPWYEKVRASYELELKDEVERMYNRFCVEGLCDDTLKTSVKGRDARNNVRNISATLWELAFKIKEKEIVIKQTSEPLTD
jgi:hypothetical protein